MNDGRHPQANVGMEMTRECAPDRPSTPMENLIGQSEQLAQMAHNIDNRLHAVLGKLYNGNPPGIESNKEQPQEHLPQIATVERNLNALARRLESILDATNGLEGL